MKKVLVLSCISAGFFLNAQTIGNSPYAAYGIGDVKYDNTVEVNAMGGITTAYITDLGNSFNFRNPAANTNFDLTSFRVEGTNETNFFKTNYNSAEATKHSTYLSQISLSFPITKKVKFGLGYQPYSSKKYDLINREVLDDGSVRGNHFVGSGTLSTLQGALSYQVTPAFALGFRSNFYFGNLYDLTEYTSSNAELFNGYETRYKVETFNFTLGSTYQKKFENDRKLTLGATYTFGNSGSLENTYTNSTYFYSTGDVRTLVDEIDKTSSQDKQLIPVEASFGLGYGRDLRWFLGTQYDYKKGEEIQVLGQPFQYNDSYRFSLGGWYLPNPNNFRNYFSRVVYRYGAYYEKGNLRINTSSINKYAVTFGATLPFVSSNSTNASSMDVGVEVGKRGTLENNLINQTFINFRIGINFADRWFQKKVIY